MQPLDFIGSSCIVYPTVSESAIVSEAIARAVSIGQRIPTEIAADGERAPLWKEKVPAIFPERGPLIQGTTLMTLQEQIKADLKAAMKNQDVMRKEALRVVIGELGRLSSKEPPDKEVLQVIKKLIKSEKEVLQRRGEAETSPYLEVLESYLPAMASESEIEAWIRANLDLAAYKNKMKAMGDIMRHFGDRADGNAVRQILQKMA